MVIIKGKNNAYQLYWCFCVIISAKYLFLVFIGGGEMSIQMKTIGKK